MNTGAIALLCFALFIAEATEAIACRDAKNGRVVAFDNSDFLTKEKADVYAYKPDQSGLFRRLELGTSSPPTGLLYGLIARPNELHFCVDLELPTPLGADAEIGLYFWRNDDNIYTFRTTGLRFTVEHNVFEDAHPLVFAAPFPIVSKEAPRMREVEFESYNGGARIKIDGRLLTDFVARPPSGDLSYGLLFRVKDKSTVLRFARPMVFGQ